MGKSDKTSKNSGNAKAVATALADIFPRMMVNMARLGGNQSGSSLPLTPPQLRAIFAIYIEEKAMPMSALANALGVTQSTATDVTKRLTSAGYLKKEKLAGDMRVVRVSLTAKGRAIAKEMKEEKFKQFAAICEALSDKKRQRLLKSHQLILEIYSTMHEG